MRIAFILESNLFTVAILALADRHSVCMELGVVYIRAIIGDDRSNLAGFIVCSPVKATK